MATESSTTRRPGKSILEKALTLVAITPGEGWSQDLVDVGYELEQGGVTAILVREPALTTRAVYEFVKALQDRVSIPLLISDRVDIAQATGVLGVHIGHRSMPPEAVRKVAGPNLVVGLSVHDPLPVRDVPWPFVDYVTLSPVFETPGKGSALGVDRWVELAREIPRPTVALGGMTPRDFGSMSADAAGIAAIRSLFRATDPRAAARAFRNQGESTER